MRKRRQIERFTITRPEGVTVIGPFGEERDPMAPAAPGGAGRKRAGRLAALGYALASGARDAWGKHWRYRVCPAHGGTGGGPTNYFGSLAEVDGWLARVEWVRGIQRGPLP